MQHRKDQHNTSKPKDPTTARLEQPNIDDEEEIDLKKVRRTFETLKEKNEKFLQRNGGKDKQKNWTSANPLKKNIKKSNQTYEKNYSRLEN